MERIYDITEVCAMLDTTSRTLRYYEAHGLIESTTAPPSRRRKYTQAQLTHIRRVMALRSLGLPVRTILALLQEGTSLEEALLSRRADILRLIAEKHREINLLEEALYHIRTGTEREETAPPALYCSDNQMEIAERCTDALLRGEYARCVSFFDGDMQTLLPAEALRRSWEIACEPVGGFLRRGSLRRGDPPNILMQYLHYEKQTVRIRYVFHGEEICGLWTDYAPEEVTGP